ncbi:Mur ligase family protein [Gryllotalpicola ginsengisoli]|uniref:Mur ligase family protein n=1 Tax=Gryllotalpicola ginsengisoli TaxID=444608 RepID=UPI0003B555BE|nr:UDP-N-acetylmuramoyl-L-alanyl-D-glutamate--2,6-diaminopimelate ligase [Gryllotalpicola ginsengisoli]
MTETQPVPPPVRPRHSPSKPLSELLDRFGDERSVRPEGEAEIELHGITLNSATVEPGDLFVALPGATQHGARFAAAARDAGAVAVITDGAGLEQAAASGLPVVVREELRASLGEIAAWLFDTAASPVTLFGVTGTNGKTSVAHMLEAILEQMGLKAGLSSTAERHFDGEKLVSGLTTPETVDLHSLIARWTECGTDAAAVEVSAQSLSRHRVDGVVFDVAGFTNLTHDHLDDYGDMQTYLDAKKPLFQPDRARRGVVCLDTPPSAELVASAGIPLTTITSLPGVEADWRVEVTGQSARGVSFTLTRASDGWSVSSLVTAIGAHMALNAGLAIAMISAAGYPDEQLAAAVASGIVAYLPGRAERVSGERGPNVFVDFGHSADAFEKTLAAVRAVTPPPGRVIMLFGADGDRDKLKRPAMSRAAVDGADLVIVTDHHPRFEDPDAIRATLVAAAKEHAAAVKPDVEVIEVAGPEKAIRVAVSKAEPGDSILWAGPGHQNYRDIRGVHVKYSAREQARQALREAGWAD